MLCWAQSLTQAVFSLTGHFLPHWCFPNRNTVTEWAPERDHGFGYTINHFLVNLLGKYSIWNKLHPFFEVHNFFWFTYKINSFAAVLYSPLLETLCFSSCLFKAPFWIPSFLWLDSSYKPETKTAELLFDMVTECDVTKSQLKGGLLMTPFKHFRSS